MCRPTNNSHVGGENNLYIGIHYVFLIWGVVRHIKEDSGQLGCPITRPVAEVAAAVGLDQQRNPLENFMQGFLPWVVGPHLLYQLKYELSLLDGGDILVRGRVLDLDLVVERSSDHISFDFLLVVLLCKLWVVVKELLYSVFVSHFVQVWMNVCRCKDAFLRRAERISEGGLQKM